MGVGGLASAFCWVSWVDCCVCWLCVCGGVLLFVVWFDGIAWFCGFLWGWCNTVVVWVWWFGLVVVLVGCVLLALIDGASGLFG